jgi:hypothetical protein
MTTIQQPQPMVTRYTLAEEDEIARREIDAERELDDFGPDPDRYLSEHDLVPAMTVDLDEVDDLNALAEAQTEAAFHYMSGMDFYPW